MAQPPGACPHCGYIDLNRMPGTAAILEWALNLPQGFTSYGIRQRFSMTSGGSTSHIRRMLEHELIVEVKRTADKLGRMVTPVYRVTDRGRAMLQLAQSKRRKAG